MNERRRRTSDQIEIRVPAGVIHGDLELPLEPRGIVVFAHGSGSSRFSPRNRLVAAHLNEGGFATLLFDLLTVEEAGDGVMKFLVTTDGSARSISVLSHAERLAQAVGAEMLLLHVLNPLGDCGETHGETLTEAAAKTRARWMRELEHEAASLRVLSSARVVTMLRGEDVSQTILRVADDDQVGLIALATHGAGAILRAVMGSVATAILGRSTLPILLAGPRVKPARGKGEYALLLTSDGSPASKSAVPVIDRLLAEASIHNLALTFLRVREEEDQHESTEKHAGTTYLDDLSALATRFSTPFRIACEVRVGSRTEPVHRHILDVAAELGADAIAMATHGHSFRHDAFLGSVAFDTLREAEIPLLLVNATSFGWRDVDHEDGQAGTSRRDR